MKVIDLLNKIANGEEIPKKIKYDNDIWNYDEISRDYILIDKSGEEALICEELNLMFALNEEVEIIEEDKKIENIVIEDKSIKVKGTYFYKDKDIEIFQKLSMVINEIIDKINEMENKK